MFIDSVRVKSELIIVQNTGFMIATKRQIFAAKVAVEVSGLTPTSKPLSSAFVPKQFTECRRLRLVTNLSEAFSHVLEKLRGNEGIAYYGCIDVLRLIKKCYRYELNAFQYGYILDLKCKLKCYCIVATVANVLPFTIRVLIGR